MSKFKVGELVWYMCENYDTGEVQIRCDEIDCITSDGTVYFNTLFENGTTYRYSEYTSNIFKTSNELLRNIEKQIKNKTWTEEFEDAAEEGNMTRFFVHKNKIKKGEIIGRQLIKGKVKHFVKCIEGAKERTYTKPYSELYKSEDKLIKALKSY
jgi:hypothetical protein